MRVESLLAAIREGAVRFSGITHDSRKVEPGYLFVALSGKRHDGHAYIQEAIGKGAACIVCEKRTTAPVPVYLADSARRWLPYLSAAVYRNPSAQQRVIGVTGSNGKTTITSMLHAFFVENRIPCGLIGTVENEINGVRTPAALTTPEAPDLQRMLAELLAGGTRHVVMEVSAQGVDMGRVDATDFSIGLFTNLTPDHLDFHHSLDAYGACKKRFMNRLAPDKIGIYNWDDPFVQQASRESRCQVFSYSLLDRQADISVRDMQQTERETVFFVRTGPKLQAAINSDVHSIPFRIHLPGLHNVSNALAALLAGLVSGLDPLHMRTALDRFAPVVRRMQTLQWNGRLVVDDTAMNPGSILAVLNTFRPEQFGRVHVAFAIRGNRGVSVNRLNAQVLAEWYKMRPHTRPQLIITSSAGHVGSNDQVSEEEEAAFLETLWKSGVPHAFYPQLPAAIEHVARTAKPGDLVFLLGAQGMDEGFRLLCQTQGISSAFVK
ncbi:Mur ligase family protein [Effusibacillus pohliae]|uniref:Mur ligase family protein n=1 Tax=Effusibacillus pohliae TaxID=232270 RepID=UPI000380C335|nr:UDP-N-acetylmuramyl-tripeptide synthetase [Effusibacillus pohliae]